MNRKSKVSEIMAEKLIVADAHNSFTQIMDFFTRSKIHHLPITQNNKIIGIVSLSDIIRYLGRVLEEGHGYDKRSADHASFPPRRVA